MKEHNKVRYILGDQFRHILSAQVVEIMRFTPGRHQPCRLLVLTLDIRHIKHHRNNQTPELAHS